MDICGKTILTGDRPTGPLHIGHLAGSLSERVRIQDRNRQTVLVADLQALTDNARNPGRVSDAILEVMLDYLAVGLDPGKTGFALQSGLPALAGLTMLYLNLVSIGRLERNPTIRAEISSRDFGGAVPAGFLCYPVSQAADITGFGADLVPAGEDQAPLIELTNEVVRRVNALAGSPILTEAAILLSRAPRLPGIDGRGKMSKSAGNAILLRDGPDEIRRKVMAMFTDPGHLRAADPGQVEGNVVFACLDAFDPERAEVEALKARYRAGGLGDMALKRRLADLLLAQLGPVRARREAFARDPGEVMRILREGTRRAVSETAERFDRVRRGFGLPVQA